MTTTRDGKRSATTLMLTGILIFMAVFGLVIFLPAVYAGEEFEYTLCVSGTYNLFHGNMFLRPVLRYEESGVLKSKSGNKFIDNATLHYEGVQRGIGTVRQGYLFGRIVDPDNDIIIVRSVYTGKGHEAEFLEGTGKYMNIKGSYKAQRISESKTGKPDTYQNCKNIKGTFELPQ